MIREAREKNDAEELGYPSWPAYVSAEFGGLVPRLSPDVRQPLVAELRGLGMSTRDIAPVVGVGKSTVADDLAAGVRSRTPDARSWL